MGNHRCPGQNAQFWGPEDIFSIPCPECGNSLEFFKDDAKRECPKCNKLVFNPRIDSGCALWCPKAEDCLGPEQYASLQSSQEIAKKRKADMELLISLVPEEEGDVRKLFKKLYIENNNLNHLINMEQLNALKESDPELFDRAVGYFSLFNKKDEE